MESDILKHLHDIRDAASAIRRFVHGQTFTDFDGDEVVQSAVERKYQIIGEALNRIRKDSPRVLGKIREHRSIVSFRNILVHGYDTVDSRIVWGIIEEDLDNLLGDVSLLLDEESPPGSSV